ncbi:hypothetical protein [Flavobacterium sp.]|uniref:hypothetical protein n=1 Tax=Flavobacterium sp. TaxID=239 RepID=UPI00262C428D|nr:hypothetical protein [Flavobacterium sp.]MDD3004657.1 hypothetical protein [Flavobacterium sp.]
MNKTTIYLFLLILATACGVKSTQNSISEGDYDTAIEKATDKLRKNKTNKKSKEYILLLEEAFTKAKERDNRDIKFLVKDANPQKLEQIFNIYKNLNARQEKIRPLLPLKVNNKEVTFAFEDYSDQIVSSKNALAKYLYDNSKALLYTNNKQNARRAHEDLVYLTQLTNQYKDTDKLIEEALFKGTDFIQVYTKNETKMIIPQNLNNALLDFNTYGLDNQWTEYHSSKQKNITYDYAISIAFKQINISPEQVKEREFQVEKEIIDGKIKKLDSRGRVMKDSLGRDILVDNVKVVKALINEVRQFKTVEVIAKIDYINLMNNQIMDTFPINSQFVFENIYAKYKGDKRAIEVSYWPNFRNGPVPFPNNQQMVYDTGEDLKAKLKNIIVKNKITAGAQ